MIFDVRSVVSSFFEETIEILRSRGSTFDPDTGFFTEREPIKLTRRVHIQPLTGRDMVKLRELHDVAEAIQVWSLESFELGYPTQSPARYGVSTYSGTPAPGESSDPNRKADKILWKGNVWEVRPIQHWSTGGYYEVTATI